MSRVSDDCLLRLLRFAFGMYVAVVRIWFSRCCDSYLVGALLRLPFSSLAAADRYGNVGITS